jgi:hypothetical protein
MPLRNYMLKKESHFIRKKPVFLDSNAKKIYHLFIVIDAIEKNNTTPIKVKVNPQRDETIPQCLNRDSKVQGMAKNIHYSLLPTEHSPFTHCPFTIAATAPCLACHSVVYLPVRLSCFYV